MMIDINILVWYLTLFTEAKADELIDVENEEKAREVKSEPQVTQNNFISI